MKIEREEEWRAEFLRRLSAYAKSYNTPLVNTDKLEKRLKAGAEEYGNKSFSRSFTELCQEQSEEVLDLAGWAYVIWAKSRVIANTTLDQRIKEQADALCHDVIDYCVKGLYTTEFRTEALRRMAVSVGKAWDADPRHWMGDMVMRGEGGQMKLEELKVDLTENLAEAISKSGLSHAEIAKRITDHGCPVTEQGLRAQLAEPSNIDILLVAFCVCGMKIALNEIKDNAPPFEDHNDVD